MSGGLPFYLANGEKLLAEAEKVFYYGVSMHTLGGIVGGGDFAFVGMAQGKHYKRERSSLDSRQCHFYLTDKRVVVVSSKWPAFLGGPETIGKQLIAAIDLLSVEGMSAIRKLTCPSIELAVRTSGGDIDHLILAFANLEEDGRDRWMARIENARSNATSHRGGDSRRKDADDPLRVLKLRLARGEISKQEYEDTIRMLKDERE